MANHPRDSFSGPTNYYQFQRDNAAYAQESNAGNAHRPSFPSYRNIDPSPRSKMAQQNYHKPSGSSIDHARKAEIKQRIKQIIDLCRDENAAVNRDMNGVMQTQRGIYNLLQQGDFDQTRLPPDTQAPQVAPTSLPYTPIRSSQQIPPPSHPATALQKDIRALIERSRHLPLSEQALQLIFQIEKRALAEVQKLANEKLAVTAHLNEQIRRGNAEKKRSVELERQLDFYRKNQGADPQYGGQLKSRIAYLQGLLQTQQGAQTAQFPDFNLLFSQGEAIRQETLRLLKLKEAKLQADDAQKRRLRQEVEHLQRKVEQLELQRAGVRGKTSYQTINEEYSPIAGSYKRRDSYRNSGNEYQSLVMEMRKITSN